MRTDFKTIFYNSTDKDISTRVSYRVLDKDNSIIFDENRTACFSKLTYSIIPKEYKKIVIFQKLMAIPYDEVFISRW